MLIDALGSPDVHSDLLRLRTETALGSNHIPIIIELERHHQHFCELRQSQLRRNQSTIGGHVSQYATPICIHHLQAKRDKVIQKEHPNGVHTRNLPSESAKSKSRRW